MAAIAAQLSRFDIVGLCEVFQASRRREIVRTLHEVHKAPFHWIESTPPTGRHLVDGGLLLLSRLPIEGEPRVLTFRNASRVYNTGLRADGLAAKGVLHARLRLCNDPPMLLDVFLTHLESISESARADQIDELSKFIARQSSPTRPMLLMGDLNVAASPLGITEPPAASEYGRLAKTLRGADPALADVWPQVGRGPGGTRDALAGGRCERIDYLFAAVRNTATGALFRPVDIRIEAFLDDRVKQGSLSDHAGVAARFVTARAS